VKVFISWSGEQSHGVALVLHEWLPTVLQHVEPWVSSEDIDKGARWIADLSRELEASKFGIICLVPGNTAEPWLNFEAGVISHAVATARVAPLLLGLTRADVKGPLAQFQSTIFEKDDVRKLLHSINRASERPVPDDRLKEAFDGLWPTLVSAIESLGIRKSESVARGVEREERVKSPLVFVQQACCRRNSSLGVLGVANPNPVTVEDASVYITIPALQIDDVAVKWAGMAPDQALDIHPGPLSRHHHLSYIVSVGDNAGQFFFHPAYGPAQPVEAGRYTAELCVKGRDVNATTARIEVVFAHPRSMTLDLLAESEAPTDA
jgi:TIR domain-containing protein